MSSGGPCELDNPCGVGECVDLGDGSHAHRCRCPSGYTEARSSVHGTTCERKKNASGGFFSIKKGVLKLLFHTARKGSPLSFFCVCIKALKPQDAAVCAMQAVSEVPAAATSLSTCSLNPCQLPPQPAPAFRSMSEDRVKGETPAV